MKYESVIEFWFKKLVPKDWFVKNPDLDKQIKIEFLDLHTQAANCELFKWRESPLGCLAEIILLDQFSRNIFRDSAQAFATDNLALALAQEAVHFECDKAVDIEKRSFFYMPYMHSESLTIHQEALKLFDQPGLENSLNFEKKHKVIIDRFGRYPHRNKILGRTSTPEEVAFLQQPDSHF